MNCQQANEQERERRTEIIIVVRRIITIRKRENER